MIIIKTIIICLKKIQNQIAKKRRLIFHYISLLISEFLLILD